MGTDRDLSAVKAICDEFEIQIIKSNEYPSTGQTRATGTLNLILRNHGEGHLRLVLSTLMEAGPRGALLDEYSLGAMSDLVVECAEWIERDLSSWYAAWDSIPFGEVMWLLSELKNTQRRKAVCFGAFYLVLQDYRGGSGVVEMVRENVDRRLFEVMKRQGTANGRAREASAALGRTILAAEKHIPADQFKAWLSEECGLTTVQARRCVKLAKEETAQMKAA